MLRAVEHIRQPSLCDPQPVGPVLLVWQPPRQPTMAASKRYHGHPGFNLPRHFTSFFRSIASSPEASGSGWVSSFLKGVGQDSASTETRPRTLLAWRITLRPVEQNQCSTIFVFGSVDPSFVDPVEGLALVEDECMFQIHNK